MQCYLHYTLLALSEHYTYRMILYTWRPGENCSLESEPEYNKRRGCLNPRTDPNRSTPKHYDRRATDELEIVFSNKLQQGKREGRGVAPPRQIVSPN